MTELFSAVTRGVSRFALTWLLPSAVVLGVFFLVAGSTAGSSPAIHRVAEVAGGGPVAAVAIFTLSALTLSTLLAYGSLPIYRLLEGYSLPDRMKRRWTASQTRRFARLSNTAEVLASLGRDAGDVRELLKLYPDDPADIRATRLGNALRGLETYGTTRYGLNSQALWYELLAVAPGTIREDLYENRGAVDLFVSALVHALALAIACLVVAGWYGSVANLVVVLISILLMRPFYDGAVRNVLEWRYSVQALINVSRADLAARLGFVFPESFDLERWLWQSLDWRLDRGTKAYDLALDRLRRRYPSSHSDHSWRDAQRYGDRGALEGSGLSDPAGDSEEGATDVAADGGGTV
jgi:hypothetical protein